MACVRTVKTASGATAVQIVWSWRRGSRSIEHIGSAHDEIELAALNTAAAARMRGEQTELDLGLFQGSARHVDDHLLANDPPVGSIVQGLPSVGVRVGHQG